MISRLLREPRQIIATGGAFMNAETRAAIRSAGLSIWLKADWELLYERVRRRPTRPLLQTADPEGTLKARRSALSCLCRGRSRGPVGRRAA